MKTISLRLDDHVAALAIERAERTGVSLNQAIQDAIQDAVNLDIEQARQRTRGYMTKYATVMERLG